jgi:hypothetical protein
VTSAIHADFGATSPQCQPTAASLSSSSLGLDIELTDGHLALPFGDACEPPYGASNCACGVCSGNQTVVCNGDADCASLGVGVCDEGSPGERRPCGHPEQRRQERRVRVAGRRSPDLRLDFKSYCADGTTEWELGGANCP